MQQRRVALPSSRRAQLAMIRRAGERGGVEDALTALAEVNDHLLDGRGDRLRTKLTDEQLKLDLIFVS